MFLAVFFNIIVVLSALFLVQNFFPTKTWPDKMLLCFLIFLAQIIIVELFLGMMGQLYFLNVFIAHLFIILIILLIRPRGEMAAFIKPNLGRFLNSNLLLFAASVFLSFFLIKAFYNLVNPPICADSLQQHLAFPASWIMSGSLDNPLQIFSSMPILNPGSIETSAGSYYPINAQLFFAWLMLPLRNAFLADLGEAPFYIIGIIAVYSILRKYNVDRTMALLSGFLWALIPNIFKQLRTGSQIDVICAVLLLLVFDTLLLLKLNFTFRNAILFGISVGLFAGTKVINLVWLAALMPLICYIFYRKLNASKFALGEMLGSLGAIVLMIIIFGGFMYIKNYFFTGNPVFPVDLRIFGKTVFRGLLDNNAYKIQIALTDRFGLIRILFREGLGVQFLTLILPGTFIPLISYRYLKGKIWPPGEYLLLFATPLIMLILYRVFINIYAMRYLFPYLTWGLLTAVIFITRLPRGDKYLAFVSFISIFASASELAHRHELIVSLLLSLLFFMLLFFYKKQITAFYKSRAFGKTMLAISVLAAISLTHLNEKYNKEEFKRYPLTFSKKEAWQIDIAKGWQKLNEITGNGSRVAYTGRQEFYPLFGTRLKNDVKYISINEKEVSLYDKPDGLCRKIKDFAAWRKNLKKENIGYLFIALPFFDNRESEDPTKFPIEDEWASSHPEDFQLLFSNSLSHIYKVHLK